MESRTPPQNLEAEQSVLGSILLDNEVYATLEGMLQPEHFYKEGHRKIYRAITRLFRRNEPMDLVTLTEELRQSNELEGVGSVAYLIGLADSVPTAAYAENYARIVVEKATLRELISASGQIMQAAYDQAGPVAEILDKAEAGIFEVTTHKRSTNFLGMGPLVSDTFNYINELFTNPDPVTGLRMGFKELDSITAGLQASSLNVLAARPSMGKCLGRGTKVLMADGSLVAVEHLTPGDRLMGPDSTPRTVLSLARGRETMYWVRQRHGVDYRVNESHILALEPKHGAHGADTVEVSVREWLEWDEARQGEHEGYKVAIELPYRSTPDDPYLVGLSLGTHRPLHRMPIGRSTPVARSVTAMRAMPARRIGSGATAVAEPSEPTEVREASPEIADAHGLPDIYLRNARDVRLALLAGLVDAAGRSVMTASGRTAWEIATWSPELAGQVKFLCDSLGYRTALTTGGVLLIGDLGAVPIRSADLELETLRDDDRSWRRTPIMVERDREDDYYGFTLTGDGLFLLEDMTVTHNTAFALTIGQNVGLREGKTVAIFNLEMSAVQLVTRMLCSEARVDMSRVRNGHLSERDFQRLADTAGRMSDAKIFIDDAADLTVMELRSRARRLMTEHDLGLIIIDYLQLMSGGGRYGSENRQQEISTISRGLKMLARELDIPVLVLSQLSRAVESRPNKRPMLSDLRECVTGDTTVALADGRRVPIGDLVGAQPEVMAVAGNGDLVTAMSDKVWSVGERDIVTVTLAGGRRIRATAKHRLLGADGWQRIAQLSAGSMVAVAEGDLSAGGDGTALDRTALDRIVSIEPAGREEVFDLTVPGPASWLASGIVSHNSGAIEQDADLVMFIYRDEYYDRQSEKQGIAEIIIGKQRNGPVGTIELQFHNAHVRFNDLAKTTG